MYCNNCGNQIPDNSKFCRFCGGEIKKEYRHQINEDNSLNSNGNKVILQNRAGKDMIYLLSVVLLIAVALSYFLPVIKSESYIEEKEYNILSLTQDVIYSNKYSLKFAVENYIFGGENLSQQKEGWNEKNETVSVFEYMYQKSLKTGDASYTKPMYKISLTFYWISLGIMAINVILIVYLIVNIVCRKFFVDGIIQQILILEGIRTAIVIFLIRTIINAVPEVFQHYDFWFGDYETADVTIELFCLLPFALLFIVMIIKNTYFKENKRRAVTE